MADDPEARGYNTTVTLTCGCSFRLNIQGRDRVPEAGWWYSCPVGRHSKVRDYTSETAARTSSGTSRSSARSSTAVNIDGPAVERDDFAGGAVG